MGDALVRRIRLSLPKPAPREKALSPQAFSAVLSCYVRKGEGGGRKGD
jgi:hypothetical protein